jgi:hypothetical protein
LSCHGGFDGGVDEPFEVRRVGPGLDGRFQFVRSQQAADDLRPGR